MDYSRISIFIDDEPSPVAQLDAPISFELDTRQMTDGRHFLKIISHGPDGREEVSQIDFEVNNGPAIAIEGIRENALVDAVLPLVIYWLWLLIIGVVVWGVYYFIAYVNM